MRRVASEYGVETVEGKAGRWRALAASLTLSGSTNKRVASRNASYKQMSQSMWHISARYKYSPPRHQFLFSCCEERYLDIDLHLGNVEP